jgi:hypothetical protein
VLNPDDRCAICGSTGHPAGPAAAEAIVTGAAAAETEWGSRGPGPAAGVFRYGTDEFIARSVVAARGRRGIRDVLVRRTVTYGPWEDAGG